MTTTETERFARENTDKERRFTSTGEKLLHHPEALRDLRSRRNHPIVLHIMPTEVCNLRCVFCSVAQRGEDGRLHKDLSLEQVSHVTGVLVPMGLKAVILSGGGEPTIYPRINALLEQVFDAGLQVGIITNGIALGVKIRPDLLNRLTWVRVSINTLDYLPDIAIPPLAGGVTLGFSYIVNSRTTQEVLERIREKVEVVGRRTPVAYVRLLPDCNLETAALEAAHQSLRRLTEELGPPFFHQYKIHERPPECHLGRVHPVLYTDGFIYPCDSLVLNSPSDDKKFHRDFALCRWNEVEAFYRRPVAGSLVDTRKCPHCVFARQNRLLREILYGAEPVMALEGDIQHVNFI
jgi:MoaA/NifB/PqqE/SkfB family radical SAM enzyme